MQWFFIDTATVVVIFVVVDVFLVFPVVVNVVLVALLAVADHSIFSYGQ